VYRAWALLAALALLVVAIAAVLASRAAGRISRPFEQLTLATRQIADGRFDVQLPQWGIAEADAAGDALRDSAHEIDALMRHERAFVRDASHQLRTPLAGILLFLQQQPPDVASAVARAHDLETTIADLLSLRSATAGGSCDPARIAGEAVRRWNTPHRPVVLRTDPTDDVGITGPALRQSLDVLLDNALRHGGGTVTVTVEPYGETVLVEVADQGTGFRDDSTPGTGLQLATNLVQRSGGSLMIRRRAPRARVALLLPPSGGDGQSSSNR
jgi:signal transduction histidine kinase